VVKEAAASQGGSAAPAAATMPSPCSLLQQGACACTWCVRLHVSCRSMQRESPTHSLDHDEELAPLVGGNGGGGGRVIGDVWAAKADLGAPACQWVGEQRRRTAVGSTARRGAGLSTTAGRKGLAGWAGADRRPPSGLLLPAGRGVQYTCCSTAIAARQPAHAAQPAGGSV